MAAAIAICASLLSPSGRHQWALSLIRQPTPYTALSFSPAWALPTTVVNGAPVRFSFTVGNHQGQAISYRYVISASGGLDTVLLGEAVRVVPAGATWTVRATVRAACAASPCQIEVRLPGHPETIDFLVSSRSGAGHG